MHKSYLTQFCISTIFVFKNVFNYWKTRWHWKGKCFLRVQITVWTNYILASWKSGFIEQKLCFCLVWVVVYLYSLTSVLEIVLTENVLIIRHMVRHLIITLLYDGVCMCVYLLWFSPTAVLYQILNAWHVSRSWRDTACMFMCACPKHVSDHCFFCPHHPLSLLSPGTGYLVHLAFI